MCENVNRPMVLIRPVLEQLESYHQMNFMWKYWKITVEWLSVSSPERILYVGLGISASPIKLPIQDT